MCTSPRRPRATSSANPKEDSFFLLCLFCHPDVHEPEKNSFHFLRHLHAHKQEEDSFFLLYHPDVHGPEEDSFHLLRLLCHPDVHAPEEEDTRDLHYHPEHESEGE